MLGGLCRIVSCLGGPGHVKHVGVAPSLELGERGGERSERVAAIEAALPRCIAVSVRVPDDIEVAVWQKFLFIAPLSVVGAVTRMPAGAVRSHESARRLLEQAMREVWALGWARSVSLPGDAVERTLAYVDTLAPETTTSMQRDILDGRPSELDNQTGAVVRLARPLGLAVPAHEFLYASLAPGEVEARRRAGVEAS